MKGRWRKKENKRTGRFGRGNWVFGFMSIFNFNLIGKNIVTKLNIFDLYINFLNVM